MNLTAESSDIAEGIVQEKLPEHIAPPSTDFLPWHKVRKQFIRQHQWNELARRNIKDVWRADLQKPSDAASQGQSTLFVKPLCCLVIPGDHLLDVRSMWAEIEPLDCYMRYLGFNEGQGSQQVGTDVHVANNAVTSIRGVVSDSHVIRDKFEAIVGKTMANQNLKQYGPYHIVNLDLCGSMFPNTESDVSPFYSALDVLLKYQFSNQKTLWLLFITTMVKPSAVNAGRMQDLCGPTMENLAAHPEFLAKVKSICPSAVADVNLVDFDSIPEAELVRLFGVALGKWLLRMGQVASPKWTVGMRRSYQYSISEENGSVMLSLAFELRPNFADPVDATGMSKIQGTQKEFPGEGVSAVKLAESVANIADVDMKLAHDFELRATLVDAAANLMESAGFNREAYLKWVADGEPVGAY